MTVAVPDFARLAVKPPRIALGKRGAKARILATALDQRGKPVAGVPVTWRSSNERVVRVAPDGTLTAVRRGKATVIATGGARSAAVRVTVRR